MVDFKDTGAFAAGAALPGASLVQYIRDAGKVEKAVKAAPRIKHKKLLKTSKVGDIFLQGRPANERNYLKEIIGKKGGFKPRVSALKDLMKDGPRIMGEGAATASGLGLRHAEVRVKGGMLGGGQSPYSETSKHLLSDRIRPDHIASKSKLRKGIHIETNKYREELAKVYKVDPSRVKAIKSYTRGGKETLSGVEKTLAKDYKEIFKADYKQKSYEHFKNLEERFKKRPTRFSKGAISPLKLSQATPFIALTPKKALTKAEQEAVSRTGKRLAGSVYDTRKAVMDGVKNVLLPTFRRKAKKVSVCDASGQHCGTLPAAITKATGRGVKTTNALPTQALFNSNYKIKGVSNKKAVLDQLRKAKRSNLFLRGGAVAGLGLGALALKRGLSKKKK